MFALKGFREMGMGRAVESRAVRRMVEGCIVVSSLVLSGIGITCGIPSFWLVLPISKFRSETGRC